MKKYRFYSILISLLLFIGLLLTGGNITGFYFYEGQSQESLNFFIGLIVILIAIFFIYINKGNLKEFLKNIISFFAVFAGLYVIIRYVSDFILFSGIISFTFGVWALIWTLTARNSLSEGSSMRNYATTFFISLVFIILLSILDMVIYLLNLSQIYIFARYILLILTYTTFVYASYKMLKLGKEFGFSDESARIKKTMRRNKW